MEATSTLVLGAAGLIGSALVRRLLRDGAEVVAAVRPGSEHRLLDRLGDTDRARLTVVPADITRPDLGLPPDFPAHRVRDVHNCAARYAFGLDPAEARAVNVDGALHVLDWSARLPRLRRLVHVTGYRASLPDNAPDWAAGAYEASKVEGDRLLRARAAATGVPLTVANPASVLGPGQYIGLAELVQDLWRGRLPAVPGRETLVPVVEVEWLAAFLARLPEFPETAGATYTLLDPDSPPLPDLVRLLAGHLGVPAPRWTVPLGLVSRLPAALTGVDRERLSFLAEDRYDTAATTAFAARAELPLPPVERVLREWADHLVSSRFGRAPADPAAGFTPDGLWVSGSRTEPDHVLLHGLPLDSESWGPVRERLGGATLAIDLPGLGRSAPRPGDPLTAPRTGLPPGLARLAPGDDPTPGSGVGVGAHSGADAGPDDRLTRLLHAAGGRPVLVAHSLACDIALRYATAHPDRVAGLVLVAPAFLRDRGPWWLRTPLTAAVLRHLPAGRLAGRLGVPAGPAIDSTAANLARPGVACRTVRALGRSDHAALRDLLDGVPVPVRLVTGEHEPLDTAAPVTVIPGAGHYPQLTHPDQVTAAIRTLSRNLPLTNGT